MAHTHDPADTHEERLAAYGLEVRAKYTAAEIEAMGEKGHAFKNDDGSYSYPIGDEEDLKNAIHAVGRGNADHNAIRKYIMGRAKDLGADVLIPSNWNSDGSLEEAKAAGDAETCPRCDGDKTVDLGNGPITCPTCSGEGAVEAKSVEDPPEEKPAELAETKANTVPATAMRAEYRNVPETRIATGPQFELREIPNGTGGTNLRFTGFASVTGDAAAYEMEDWLGPWIESVNTGAFKKTLDEGADVAFLLNHSGMTLARTKPGTLKLSEETDGASSPVYGVTGLHSEAMLDPTNMYVQAMRSAVDRGDLDEMSFAFRVMRQEWNNDYTRRWINEVSLDKGDVSLVNYGANPTTGGTVAMRQRLGTRRDPMDIRRFCVRLLEVRLGATLSTATMGSLQDILDLIDASDTNVDKALVQLSDLMGVTNPDIAQDAELDRGCGCCSDCTDDCDGSCCDDCEMGDGNPDPDEGDEQLAHGGLFVERLDLRHDRARLEALRHRQSV